VRRRSVLVVGIVLIAAGGLAGRIAAAGASIALTPASGPSGTSVTVKGTGFLGREQVTISFDTKQVGSTFTDTLGRFTATIKVPTATLGTHTVKATGFRSRRIATAPFTVTDG